MVGMIVSYYFLSLNSTVVNHMKRTGKLLRNNDKKKQTTTKTKTKKSGCAFVKRLRNQEIIDTADQILHQDLALLFCYV